MKSCLSLLCLFCFVCVSLGQTQAARPTNNAPAPYQIKTYSNGYQERVYTPTTANGVRTYPNGYTMPVNNGYTVPANNGYRASVYPQSTTNGVKTFANGYSERVYPETTANGVKTYANGYSAPVNNGYTLPTNNGYTTAQGHYISASGTYYTPQGHYISGNGNYSAPSTNAYTSANDGSAPPTTGYVSPGHYFSPTAGADSSAGSDHASSGNGYVAAGSYYPPSSVVYSPAKGGYSTPPNEAQTQPRNATPRNQMTPQPAASSSMNTASAADAANSLKTVAQSGQASPWITFEGGITTPTSISGTLDTTYDSSGTKIITGSGGEGFLSFSAYHTDGQDNGLCWSPGISVPGAAKINLNACGGTDGAKFGASGGIGPFTGGVSFPSQDIMNLYMDSIYGAGNWLGTGLYNAAPAYFDGNH